METYMKYREFIVTHSKKTPFEIHKKGIQLKRRLQNIKIAEL